MLALKDVIRELRAKKSLGQNFLIDPHILARIVESAGDLKRKAVIEVGPGPGGLTREIVKKSPQEFFLIEQDERCLPFLEPLKDLTKGHFVLLHDDALALETEKLGSPPRKIISNLPYNISVPLLINWLEHIDNFERLTLMFQKEVADRILAKPNTAAYGRLSVMCQWAANVEKSFDLPPGAFFPPPKVTSTVLQFAPRHPREDVSWAALESVTKAAFSMRRKMLRSSLKSLVPNPLPLLEKAGIVPTLRAENLSVEAFCRLAKAYESK